MRKNAIRFAIAALLAAAATVSWLALCRRLPAPALAPIGIGLRSAPLTPVAGSGERDRPAVFEA